jgi:hypothetical protein
MSNPLKVLIFEFLAWTYHLEELVVAKKTKEVSKDEM